MEIRRDLLPELTDHLNQKEMTLLIGPRQAGKTTLLQALQADLEAKGETTLFFNLDKESDFAYFTRQITLLKKLALEAKPDRKLYVFIDEIQRKEDAGRFMKGIYDQDLPYKFILSGSGSLELKEKIQESMAGRKRLFELSPVTFKEFLDYRTGYRFADRLADWTEVETSESEQLLLEYLNYGGYPRVVTANRAEEKVDTLNEILQSYLLRDIYQLLNLDRPDQFSLLLRLVANRAGQPINYSSLSREVGLSTPTLKKYLWYAERTFILTGITPFFRNPEKELVKAPSYYYRDLGLRNFNLQRTGKIRHLSEDGFLFQNFIFLQLYEHFHSVTQPVKYWRTQQKTEIDFILERGVKPLPIEVKSSALSRPTLARALRSFIQQYQPEEAWVINLRLRHEMKIDQTRVRFLPWWNLIFLNSSAA